MTATCDCGEPHPERRIVLTGGPGAGKTAVLELVRHTCCRHTHVLPEAAGILFGGGFPRASSARIQRAAQRAIFFTQRELEASVPPGVVTLCDRGTIDGAAYWPGPEDLWASVGSSRAEQLLRYDAVIHLRTPAPDRGYDRSNPLRIETAAEAAAIDERILAAWDGHPRRHVVEATPDFLAKVQRALALLREELPACCSASRSLRSVGPPALR